MFTEPHFWFLILGTAIIARAVPLASSQARSWVYSAASTAAIGWFMGIEVLGAVLTLSIWVFLAGRYLATRKGRVGTLAVALIFSAVLLFWITGKYSDAFSLGHYKWIAFAGMSFFLVKAWTFMKDASDGRLKEIVFPDTLAYLLFFPAFLMGPMHLYKEYTNSVRDPEKLDGEAVIDIFFRVSIGLTKVYLIAPFFSEFSLQTLQNAEAYPILPTFVAAMSYYIVIYSDFSGFSDLAIATARLAGIKLPKNFNRPYLATNIRDFWTRWHITFTRVLTSYIFVPISRSLTKRLGGHPKLVMVLGYLVTFAFCGYWHGPTLNFVFWGLYHACGLIIFDLFKKPASRKKRLKEEKESLGQLAWERLKTVPSMALTFAFVSIGWFFFVIEF